MYTSDLRRHDTSDVPPKWGFRPNGQSLFDIPDRVNQYGTLDYTGWNLNDAERAWYNTSMNYGGMGLQRAMNGEGMNAVKEAWNVHATNYRRNLKGLTPKMVAKTALNNYLESLDYGINTWNNWDWEGAKSVGERVSDATGNKTIGKLAEVATHIPGKALHVAGPLADVADFGIRVASGENAVRAGVGTGGSLIGGQIGFALGSMTPLGPVGGFIGGMAGSIAGDWIGNKAYELVTEDALERARKGGGGGGRENDSESMNPALRETLRRSRGAVVGTRSDLYMPRSYLSSARNIREETLNQMAAYGQSGYNLQPLY